MSSRREKQQTVEEEESADRHYPLLDALFFSSSTPLTLDQIRRSLDLNVKSRIVKRLVDDYIRDFNAFHSGVRISKTRDRLYVMHVNPEYVERLRRYIHPPPLTDGQLNTLAFIYKNQPVYMKRLAAVFGSRAYRDVKKLTKLRLVTRRRMGRESLLRIREAAKPMIRLK